MAQKGRRKGRKISGVFTPELGEFHTFLISLNSWEWEFRGEIHSFCPPGGAPANS
jgi:hypothetical protein